MKHTISALLLALAATSVWAQESPPKLDLTLPTVHDASAPTTSAATPAGVSGNDAVDASDSQADPNRADPNRIDPTKLRISGEVSTTIGYAKGYGSGISNAAELDISKQTDDGKSFNLHLDVRKSDGFPNRGYGYPYHW